MGQLHDAVSNLISAFSHGISIIDTQRGRRTKQQQATDKTSKDAEVQLQRSLKRNRTDVKTAYGKDLRRFGPGFAAGDEESRSSLSAILFRLNAGFVSVIERFMKGRSTTHDYQVLLNLSNASRIEAMHTFEQLSNRLSTSSLALAPAKPTQPEKRTRSKRSSSSVGKQHKKSAPKASTPLGLATPEGWVRPKGHRRRSSDSSKSSKSSTGNSTPKPKSRPPPSKPPVSHSLAPVRREPQMTVLRRSEATKVDKRKSIMSFASDSTKLGEIPEHKWARNVLGDAGSFPIVAYYPLEPYREPEKQRSRFMRLFRR